MHIASNTFREAVRDRVLYNLIVFALLMSGAAVLVGQISIDIERLVVINLGLTAVSLFGMVIAIFIGIGLVSKEIEKRTLYTVLSRPVRRWEFIVGKFFGLAGTLVVNTFFMAIGVFAALLYVSHHFQKPDGWVLVALYFIILQFLIITALTLLFSSFSSPLLSAVFAFSLFVIGSFAEDLRGFAGMTHGVTRWLATGAAYLVPNFSALNVISSVAHAQPVPGTTDSLQQRLRPGLCRHGHLRGGADIRAPEPEMNAIAQSHDYGSACCWSLCLAASVSSAAPHRPAAHRRHAGRSPLHFLAQGAEASEPGLRRPAGRHLLDARGAVFRQPASSPAPAISDLLAPLLEITTTLDPHLLVAYEYGANFLAPKPPNGAGMPEKAIQLEEFGIHNNPNDWQLYYELGFIHYMDLKDYAKAAEAFARGSQIPNAHPFLKVMAAQMAQHAGDTQMARADVDHDLPEHTGQTDSRQRAGPSASLAGSR